MATACLPPLHVRFEDVNLFIDFVQTLLARGGSACPRDLSVGRRPPPFARRDQRRPLSNYMYVAGKAVVAGPAESPTTPDTHLLYKMDPSNSRRILDRSENQK